MKPRSAKKCISGFSVWDLLVVLTTAALLVLIWPMFARGKFRTRGRPHCVNNLRQIGLAFRVWSNDHGEKFPMAASTNQGGSSEFVGTADVFRHYLAMSNELNNPNIVTCPSDKGRKRTSNLLSVRNKDLSYFVGLDAIETEPQMVLSGDRNITTNGRLTSGILTLTGNSRVSWTKDIHHHNGNIGLADGSAQQVTDITLKQQIRSSPSFPVRLAVP